MYIKWWTTPGNALRHPSTEVYKAGWYIPIWLYLPFKRKKSSHWTRAGSSWQSKAPTLRPLWFEVFRRIKHLWRPLCSRSRFRRPFVPPLRQDRPLGSRCPRWGPQVSYFESVGSWLPRRADLSFGWQLQVVSEVPLQQLIGPIVSSLGEDHGGS